MVLATHFVVNLRVVNRNSSQNRIKDEFYYDFVRFDRIGLGVGRKHY